MKQCCFCQQFIAVGHGAASRVTDEGAHLVAQCRCCSFLAVQQCWSKTCGAQLKSLYVCSCMRVKEESVYLEHGIDRQWQLTSTLCQVEQ